MKHFIKTLSYVIFLTLLISNITVANASFSDVQSSHDNFEAINHIQNEGIISGYSDGTYKPDKTINRAEFTKIVIGAKFDEATINGCIEQNVSPQMNTIFFPDVVRSDWFAPYICVAKMNNIIKGYSDGTFKPNNEINFSEAAKIISVTFGLQEVTADPWYKPYVENLAEDKAIPTSIITFSEFITRGEMAEMIYRLIANVTNKESWTYSEIDNGTAAGSGSGVNANINLFIGLDAGNQYTSSYPIYRFDCFTSGCDPVQLYTDEWKLNTMNRIAVDTARNQIIYPAAAGVFQLEAINIATKASTDLGLISKYPATYEPAIYGDTMAFASFDSQTEIISKYNLVTKTASDISAFKGHLGCSDPVISSAGKIYGVCRDGGTSQILDENGTSYYTFTTTNIDDYGITALALDINGNAYFVENEKIKKLVLSSKAVSDVSFGSGYTVSDITVSPYGEYLAAKAYKNSKWDIAVKNMNTGVLTVLKTVTVQPGMPVFGPYLSAEGESSSTTTTTTTATCSTSTDMRDAIVQYLTATTDAQKLACMTDWAKQYPAYLVPEVNLTDVQPNGNDDEIRGIDSHSAEIDVYYWYGTSTTPVTKIFTMDKSSGNWLIHAIVQQ